MSLEEMLLRNELERLEPSAGEIDRLLGAIARRLEDARNLSIHAETRLLAGLSRHPQLERRGLDACKSAFPTSRGQRSELVVTLALPLAQGGAGLRRNGASGMIAAGSTRSCGPAEIGFRA